MRNKIAGFIIGIAALGLIFLVLSNYFEIVPYNKYLPPSRKAEENDYLALDKWLTEQGISIRLVESGDSSTLESISANVIMIQTGIFNWDDASVASLDEWVRNGGHLVLCLHYYRTYDSDDALGAYLYSLGIEPAASGENYEESMNYAVQPAFGRNIAFLEPEDAAYIIRDRYDNIRYIELEHGSGKITVTGRPNFMTSYQIGDESNARLSWYLFGGAHTDDNNTDILFIRGERNTQSAMSWFFGRGNFFVIIIAAVTLIVIGFWMAIPLFGVVGDGGQKPGKTLAERFLAEGRFLKRYRSLDTYRSVCKKEMKRRIDRNAKKEELVIFKKLLERL